MRNKMSLVLFFSFFFSGISRASEFPKVDIEICNPDSSEILPIELKIVGNYEDFIKNELAKFSHQHETNQMLTSVAGSISLDVFSSIVGSIVKKIIPEFDFVAFPLDPHQDFNRKYAQKIVGSKAYKSAFKAMWDAHYQACYDAVFAQVRKSYGACLYVGTTEKGTAETTLRLAEALISYYFVKNSRSILGTGFDNLFGHLDGRGDMAFSKRKLMSSKVQIKMIMPTQHKFWNVFIHDMMKSNLSVK